MILLTGGYGFLGSHVFRRLTERGYRVCRFRSRECNLQYPIRIADFFMAYQPTVVIHCAADVGGIEYNRLNGPILLRNNLEMGMNLIRACQRYGVDKLILIGSVCAYPGNATLPITEDQLWVGRPEESNAGYGLAKRMICEMGINAHGNGLNVVNLILSNLYGPGDNYDPDKSHVAPAIVKKLVDAHRNNSGVTFWGTGKATRDLLYVDDAADAIVRAFESLTINDPRPINIATNVETPVNQIVEMVSDIIGYDVVNISWDISKSDGQARRAYDITRAFEMLGWFPKTVLNDGLWECVKDYQLRSAQ